MSGWRVDDNRVQSDPVACTDAYSVDRSSYCQYPHPWWQFLRQTAGGGPLGQPICKALYNHGPGLVQDPYKRCEWTKGIVWLEGTPLVKNLGVVLPGETRSFPVTV